MTDVERAERRAQKASMKHAAEISRLESEVAEHLIKIKLIIDGGWCLSIGIPEKDRRND